MKPTLLTLAALVAWTAAVPQVSQVQPTSTSLVTVFITGEQPVETPIINLPVPSAPAVPVPEPPVPIPSDPAQPAPPDGAHCICGATYCGKVLIGFQGYTTEQLNQGYCATPGTDCASAAPTPESLQDTLFVCICPVGQDEGSAIELVCPCQGRCKNDEPDFIGRCETPCNLGCAPAAPAGSVAPLPAPVPVPAPAPAPVEPFPGIGPTQKVGRL